MFLALVKQQRARFKQRHNAASSSGAAWAVLRPEAGLLCAQDAEEDAAAPLLLLVDEEEAELRRIEESRRRRQEILAKYQQQKGERWVCVARGCS